ncbi:MAG: ABC transporter permease subunit [Oscillospiraceae bacterium]|nr:ABC transporter permease subunit [Oscillospiraceae bacterium]
MTAPQQVSRPSAGISSAQIKKLIALTSMALPGAIWLILLRYLPMFGIVIAFKDYRIYTKAPSLINNILHSKWVGFKNFTFLFTTTDSLRMIRNTVGFNLLWIVLIMAFAVFLAILLAELPRKRIAKTYQTMMFFPYFLSWVVVSYFVFAFLSPDKGLITVAQKNAGLMPTNWYNDPRPWPFILTIANLWKNTGYSSILYLATITGIDATQYEASRIDGANRWQQVRYVTLPHLRPMIMILLIMNLGKIINADFGLFYSVPMNSGRLFSVTQVIDTYVYRALINTGNVGMSTAAGLFQNVVGFVFLMGSNAIVRKVDPENSLF